MTKNIGTEGVFPIIIITALVVSIGLISSSTQAYATSWNGGDWLKQRDSYKYGDTIPNLFLSPQAINDLAAFVTAQVPPGAVHVLTPSEIQNPWWVGKGLQTGDYFRYSATWVQWRNNAPVELDFWVVNETDSGVNLLMVAHDGSTVQKGIVKIGYVAPDPIYYDPNMGDYATYFKRTLAWLDAFATQTTPVDPSAAVWGHTGIFGEVTLGNVGKTSVSVQGGTFDAYDIQFRDSGVNSDIYVDPSVPFPVKAHVYAIKTSGAPTIGYQLELLEKGNSPTPPSFLNVQEANPLGGNPQCPVPGFGDDSVQDVITTDTGSVNVDYIYSPKTPHQGCPISWRFKFEPVYNANQLIPDSHFNVYAVDDKGQEIYSLAKTLGVNDLYAAVGHDDETFIIKQAPPTAHYLVYYIGTGPSSGVTDVSQSGIANISIDIGPPFESTSTNATTGIISTQNGGTSNAPSVVIPSWIKNTAKWWSQGQLGDSDFIKGLQYMIQNGIMQVPHGQSGASTSQSIPSWIKNNAGWWADGQISDSDFVKGIQYMISNGIITLQS